MLRISIGQVLGGANFINSEAKHDAAANPHEQGTIVVKPGVVMEQLDLRPLGDLSERQVADLLAIRNQVSVRRNMYTSHIIGEEEHAAWVRREDGTKQFFAVYFNRELVGGISLNAISLAHKRADWAFYLSESVQGKGLGSALEFMFLDYAFDEVGLEKVNCEVLSCNETVIRLHKKFGFVEEGVRRLHIRRAGGTLDAVLLGITRGEWQERRAVLKLGAFR